MHSFFLSSVLAGMVFQLAAFSSISLTANAETRGRIPEGIRLVPSLDYGGIGSKRQTLDLYLPERVGNAARLPLIVYIHGGGWMVGDKRQAKWRMQAFMESGEYAVASVNYRLSGDDVWPAQIHDCKAALRWLKAHADEYGYNKDRFILVGVSAGGHLAAMLATTENRADLAGNVGEHLNESDDVAAAVVICGPTALIPLKEATESESRKGGRLISRLLGTPANEQPELARSASPLTYASKKAAPMLLVYGEEDPLVTLDHGVEFHDALRDAGAKAVLLRVAGAGHLDLVTPEAGWMIGQFTGAIAAGRPIGLVDTVLRKGE